MKHKPQPIPKNPAFKDLTNQTLGELTAEFYVGRVGKGAGWFCRCSCGRPLVVNGSDLALGKIRRCPECRSPSIKPTHKECAECGRLLPFGAEHFWSSNQCPFGLRARCKSCVAPAARQWAQSGLQKIRLEVLTHYSGGEPTCACCGEKQLPFLAIDHLVGSSQADYRKFRGSGKFYYHLRKEGFPPGFQILCHNCNQCRRTYGYCVHRPPEGIVNGTMLYVKEWRLRPSGLGHACIHCERKFPRTKAFFPRHRMMSDGLLNACHDCNRHNQTSHARDRNLRQKHAVFRHYCHDEPHCDCCGNSTFEFLCIDHINGGGAKHRRELNGVSVYSWLIRSGFPEGFRVLCHSCNQASGFYGQCPHTLGKAH